MSSAEVRERSRKNDGEKGENTTPPINKEVVSSDTGTPDETMDRSSSDTAALSISSSSLLSLSEISDLPVDQDRSDSEDSISSHLSALTAITDETVSYYKEECARLKHQNKKLKKKIAAQKDDKNLPKDSEQDDMLDTIIELEAKLTAERLLTENLKEEKASTQASLAQLCAELDSTRLELHSEQTGRQEMEEKLKAAGVGEFFPSHHQDKVTLLEEELELVQFMKDEADADLLEQQELNKELQKTIESLQADLKTRPNSGCNLVATKPHIVCFTPDPATTRSNLAITKPNLVWLEPDNVEPSCHGDQNTLPTSGHNLTATQPHIVCFTPDPATTRSNLAITKPNLVWLEPDNVEPRPAHADSESDTESICSTDSLDDGFPSRTDKLDNVRSTRSIAVGTEDNETDPASTRSNLAITKPNLVWLEPDNVEPSKLHSEQTGRQEMEEKLKATGVGEFFPSHHEDKVTLLEEELELVQFMKDEADADLMEQKKLNKELQKTIESLQADLKTRTKSGSNLVATQPHIVCFTPDQASTRSNLAITEPNLVWLEPDNVEQLTRPAHADSESDTESICSTDSLDDGFPSRTDKLDNVRSTRSIAVGTEAKETDQASTRSNLAITEPNLVWLEPDNVEQLTRTSDDSNDIPTADVDPFYIIQLEAELTAMRLNVEELTTQLRTANSSIDELNDANDKLEEELEGLQTRANFRIDQLYAICFKMETELKETRPVHADSESDTESICSTDSLDDGFLSGTNKPDNVRSTRSIAVGTEDNETDSFEHQTMIKCQSELEAANITLARTELEIEDLKSKLAILESGGFWWPSPAHAESESDAESISTYLSDSLDDAFRSGTDKLDNVTSTRSIAVGTGDNETDYAVRQTISSSTQTCNLTCQTCSTQTSTIKTINSSTQTCNLTCKTITSSTQTCNLASQTTTTSTQTDLTPKRLRQVLSVVMSPTSHDETVALELFGPDEPRPSSGLTLLPPNAEPLHAPPAGPDRSHKLGTYVPAGQFYMDSFKVMDGRTTFTVISDRELAVVQYPP
ncbi:uncharacterized protein LOC144924294 isoform X2 [Branchiostoma floridae x Branchiostoma belcheri]